MASVKQSDCIYLDYNATTPIAPEVAGEMDVFSHGELEAAFGNPSSLHCYGKQTKMALQQARQRIAAAINSLPEEVMFCSGGTESINHVIKSCVFQAFKPGGPLPHIVTTKIEHVAVLDAVKWVTDKGFATSTLVDVDSMGIVCPSEVAAAVTEHTVLVSVMTANNEIGTVQPIRDIMQLVKDVVASNGWKQCPLLHTDASQAVGKIPIDVKELQVDAMSVAGHKIYAPKGIGITFLRTGVVLENFMHGAGQEGGRRAGTENVMFAAGLGKAFESFCADISVKVSHLRGLRNQLMELLLKETALRGLPSPIVHGPLQNGTEWNAAHNATLPNTLSIAFPGSFAATMVGKLSKTVAVSAGAACHAEHIGDPRAAHVSHVLTAMKVNKDVSLCTLRLSVGCWTTADEISRAAVLIAAAAKDVLAVTGPVLQQIAAEVSLRTEPAYLTDTYQFSCDATVLLVCNITAEGAVTPDGKIIGPAMPGATHAVVLNRTVAHPQGGGQPADKGVITCHVLSQPADVGVIASHGIAFSFQQVRNAPTHPIILHYGTFDAPVADDALSALRGAPATVHIDEAYRRLCARLHSAGHLLDLAVTRVYARLAEAGTVLESLIPGKGYHFADGPNVEYVGSIDPAWRDKMVDLLNDECKRLIEASNATEVVYVPPVASELMKYKLTEEACAHLPPGAPVRVVMVGSDQNPCPCGGTHIKNTAELCGVTVTKIAVKKGRTKVSYLVDDA